jgi:preprotein translocase subunit YajC
MIVIPLSILLAVSVATNVFFILRPNSKSRRENSRTAEELLADLLRGTAIVRIDRIAPSDVLLRSPR